MAYGTRMTQMGQMTRYITEEICGNPSNQRHLRAIPYDGTPSSFIPAADTCSSHGRYLLLFYG